MPTDANEVEGARLDFGAMRRRTPARLGVGRAGPRYTTVSLLKLCADHARAVDAVRGEVAHGFAARHGMIEVHSRADSREEFLLRPELGRRLALNDERALRRMAVRNRRDATARRGRLRAKPRATILIVIGDGLSSAAVEAHASALARALRARLARRYRLLEPIFVRNARVRIEDHIGEIIRPDLICMLVGERPGLATAESLSAYVLYRPRLDADEPDRTVISNIHPGGLEIAAAAARIAEVIDHAIAHRASGNTLAAMLAGDGD
jgi:ethanolamine ammonia-lyase small subunit